MKHILITALLIATAACTGGGNGGGTTTPEPTSTTLPGQPPVTDAPGSEKPSDTTELGLKMGLSKEIGQQKIYRRDTWAEGHAGIWGALGSCNPGDDIGSLCSEVGSGCKKSENPKVALYCENKLTFKNWGWAYEKVGKGDYKPMAGADAYLFSFGLCIAGMCKPMSAVVKTNEYGYFEFHSDSQMDTIRVVKSGYYSGQCVNTQPYEFSGDNISGTDKRTGPFILEKIMADTCKLAPKSVGAKYHASGLIDKDGKLCNILADGSEFCLEK